MKQASPSSMDQGAALGYGQACGSKESRPRAGGKGLTPSAGGPRGFPSRREARLIGLTDGVRESLQSWKELLLDLKRHGLSMGPALAGRRNSKGDRPISKTGADSQNKPQFPASK
jgi:hypothetical protein